MTIENLSTLKIHKLTQDQYERELANGNIDENALYLTPDETADLSAYATKDQLDGKANLEHAHEISDISDLQHAIDTTLASANSYTDTKMSGVVSDTVIDNKITSHNTSSVAHNDIRDLISTLTTKVNKFLDVSDTASDQLSEILTLIENNKESLDSITSNKINVADIVDNLTTSNTSKVLSAKQGVALKSLIDALNEELDGHGHEISDITGLQSALDSKASTSHTHKYAESSSVGGAATSANKLNTNAGSTTQPVYFLNGVPVATTYTLEKSVPSNAVFTDTNTHYTSKNVVGATNATSNTTSALSNGSVYLNSVENGAVTSSHKISGSGATTVTTDASGNIIISSTDNNTTYNAAGSSLGLVKSGGDVTISSGVITVNDDSHNHVISNIDNLQTSLDAKQATITGGATTITSSNLTTNRALISNGSGKVAVSAVTSTELGYLDGVTSNIQTQLNGKAASSHTHSSDNVILTDTSTGTQYKLVVTSGKLYLTTV